MNKLLKDVKVGDRFITDSGNIVTCVMPDITARNEGFVLFDNDLYYDPEDPKGGHLTFEGHHLVEKIND